MNNLLVIFLYKFSIYMKKYINLIYLCFFYLFMLVINLLFLKKNNGTFSSGIKVIGIDADIPAHSVIV